MRRISLLAASWFAFALGPLRADSSVWKVTRNGNTVYLGGTIHLLRTSDLPLPAEFDQAFAASSRLFFETDIAKIQSTEMQRVIATRGMFTDGKSLESVLTPEAWKVAEAYARKSGLPFEQVKQFKPWLFIVVLAQVELQKMGISAEGVDLRLSKQAAAAGKKTGELESFEQHVDYLVNLGAGHESEMVKSSIEDLAEMPQVINKLIAAWKTGDLATIDTFMLDDMRVKYPGIFKDLIVSRNNLWLPKIEDMLKTPEVEFVLAGAGHLAGKEGLIAQLKAKGCVVEQVKATAPAAAKK
jgi:uncharacterized protein